MDWTCPFDSVSVGNWEVGATLNLLIRCAMRISPPRPSAPPAVNYSHSWTQRPTVVLQRIRMYCWKQWRSARTKVKNLVRLGVRLDFATKHALTRRNFWRLSRTPAMRFAMPNKWLHEQ